MGRSLKVLKRNLFSYFRLGVFMHNGDENKENGLWRCGGVYGFYVFVLLSFIWDE